MPKHRLPGASLSSGELSALAGVSTDTLRHYERRRLLQPVQRTQSGYRRYPAAAVQRVRMIRGALAIGFSIAELHRVFQTRDGGGSPCQAVRNMAAAKASDLQKRIREMQTLRKQLLAAIRGWDRKLRDTRSGGQARLLEDFVRAHPESTRRISPLVSPGLKRKLQSQGGR